MENYDPEINYIEILEELWKDKRTGESSGHSENIALIKQSDEWKNQVSYKLCVATIGAKLKTQKAIAKIYNDLGAGTDTNQHFVSIGFSEELFTIKKFRNWWNKMTSKASIINAKGVIERHSESGVNTHCHIIIESPLKKGRLIQFIWESAGIKKLVGDRQKIDVRPYEERHEDYIIGDKKAEKMENVEKDRNWRKSEGLPDILSLDNV